MPPDRLHQISRRTCNFTLRSAVSAQHLDKCTLQPEAVTGGSGQHRFERSLCWRHVPLRTFFRSTQTDSSTHQHADSRTAKAVESHRRRQLANRAQVVGEALAHMDGIWQADWVLVRPVPPGLTDKETSRK